ncbi:MAG: ferritin-like domain-containing protein [bacterium]
MEPTDNVRREWAARVEAEYRSAAITQHLTLWLIQLGASPDLIRDGLRITDDELVHAEMAFATLTAAGGSLAGPFDRATLGLRRDPTVSLEVDVALAVAEVFCLGETVAVPLFSALRAGCTVPVAREALDRVLVDEVRHRDFGWTALTWLLDHGLAELRPSVSAALPAMFARQRRNYGVGAPAGGALSPAEIAWGLMDLPRYAATLEATLDRQYIPRFERLGIDAAAAWRGTPGGAVGVVPSTS